MFEPNYTIVKCAEYISNLCYSEATEIEKLSRTSTIYASARDSVRSFFSDSEALPCSSTVEKALESIEVVDFADLLSKNPELKALRMIVAYMMIAGERYCFVGFRGTRAETLEDWLHSAKLWATTTAGIVGGKHYGYSALADLVNVRYLVARNVKGVVFCGHSLGGGVAKILAINALLAIPTASYESGFVRCICFCDPMSVDEEYAKNALQIYPKLPEFFHSYIVAGDIVPIVLGLFNQSDFKDAKGSSLNEFAAVVASWFFSQLGKTAGSSFSAFAFPKYAHVGTIHILSPDRYDLYESNADILQMIYEEYAKVNEVQHVINRHKLKTLDAMLTKHFGDLNPLSLGSATNCYRSDDYKLCCLPVYMTHEVQRILYQENGSSREQQKVIIHVEGSNLLPNFINFDRIHFITSAELKPHEILFDDSYVTTVVEGEMIKISAKVEKANNINWDFIACVICPYFDPIPLSNARMVKGNDPWSNADPADILQTALIHTLVSDQLNSDAAYRSKTQEMKNILIDVYNALSSLDVSEKILETTKVNKTLAILIDSKEQIGQRMLTQEELDYFAAKVQERFKQDAKEKAAKKSEATTVSAPNSSIETLAEDLLTREVISMSEIYSNSAIIDTEGENTVESRLKLAFPAILFMSLQISIQGVKNKLTMSEMIADNGNKWAVAGGAILLTAGIGVLTAGIGLPIVFASLSAAGVAGAVGGAVGGATGIAFGATIVHKNKASDQKIEKKIMVEAAGNYRNRISYLLDLARQGKSLHGFRAFAVIEEQEAELLRYAAEGPSETHYFHPMTADYVKMFVVAVRGINRLRQILRKIKIVGMMGIHSGGKSSFLYNGYRFGVPFTGNPVRTERATPYLHPANEDVLFIDFPGENELGMNKSMRLLVSVTMDVVVFFTSLQEGIGKYLGDLYQAVEKKKTPVLLCFNQVDLYWEKATKGNGSTRRPQHTYEAGVIWMIEKYLEGKYRCIQYFGSNCEVWMTQLNRPKVDEDLMETLKILETDEELIKAFQYAHNPCPVNFLSESPYTEIRNILLNPPVVHTIEDVRAFIAKSCYPRASTNVEEGLGRSLLLRNLISEIDETNEER